MGCALSSNRVGAASGSSAIIAAEI